MSHIISIHLVLRNAVYLWQYHQHHMILMLAPVASHGQKVIISCYFQDLDTTIVVVLFMMLYVSHNANTDTIGVTWPKVMFYFISIIVTKWMQWYHAVSVLWHQCRINGVNCQKSCCISFWLSWPNKCRGANDNAISSMWCKNQCQWHHMTHRVMLHWFGSSWHNKCSGTTGSAISFTCCQCWWKWHNMTKKWCCILFGSSWSNECSGEKIDGTSGIMWCQCQWQWHHLTRNVM